MTAQDLLQLRGWIDIIVKAVIGLVVTLVGYDYKSLKSSLFDLQKSRYELSIQVQVAQNEIVHVKSALDRIEKKLDNLKP